MTGRRWTEADQEAQDEDGRQAKGCALDMLGCGAEGCLTVFLPVLVLAATWYYF